MTINLTGMNGSNKLNLTGKTECLNPIINKMNILKKNIIKNYILPVYSDKWDVLIKNSLLTVPSTLLTVVFVSALPETLPTP